MGDAIHTDRIERKSEVKTMILKTDYGYFNLDRFSQFHVYKTWGESTYWIVGHTSYESEELGFVIIHTTIDETITQTILDEIIHRWISGDKFCNLSTILDEIFKDQEDSE